MNYTEEYVEQLEKIMASLREELREEKSKNREFLKKNAALKKELAENDQLNRELERQLAVEEKVLAELENKLAEERQWNNELERQLEAVEKQTGAPEAGNEELSERGTETVRTARGGTKYSLTTFFALTERDLRALAPAQEKAKPEKKFVIEGGVLTAYHGGGGEVVIPNGVTGIGDYAFWRCESLTGVAVPDSVISIGVSAFHWCESLESINIPDGVTSIGSNAFARCESLTELTIPQSVTSIGNDAFYGCGDLTVKCRAGSYAERYCRENRLRYTTFGVN